jgi:hypothetical protein
MDPFLLVFVIALVYILFLFICRYLNIGEKKTCGQCNNCCPDCSFALNRIKRKYKDLITNNLTFRIFDSKRYICTECGWGGLRWEDRYKSKGN